MQANQQKPNKEKETGLQSYARFSGLAFQMIAIILVFVWGGRKLDSIYFPDKSVFIIIFSLAGVFISLYVALKGLINTGKKK
ncbi:MAG: AtpZ/AtpI family protein [Bacteroidales bacterium]|nr:AtpZ/AtpI family protein [Bacteroidales bacterium]